MTDQSKRRGRPPREQQPKETERKIEFQDRVALVDDKGNVSSAKDWWEDKPNTRDITDQTIQPISVEVKPQSSQPTRVSRPVNYGQKDGVWLIDTKTSKRTWMGRKAAESLRNSNNKKYLIQE